MKTFSFLPGGKVKVTEYVWQWKEKAMKPDSDSSWDQYNSEMIAIANSSQELIKEMDDYLSDDCPFTSDELREFLDKLKEYTVIKFERPCLIALEDTKQYTWMQKNRAVTLKNINSSSDSKEFVYALDFGLVQLGKGSDGFFLRRIKIP